MLTVRLHPVILELPFPTQWLAPYTEGGKAQGDQPVTRRGSVSDRRTYSLIELDALPGGHEHNGPGGGECSILVRWLPGLTTPEQVRAHFFLEQGERVAQQFRDRPGAISAHQTEALVIVEISYTKAGWKPGGRHHYLLPRRKAGALQLAPTYFLEFDWAQARCRVA